MIERDDMGKGEWGVSGQREREKRIELEKKRRRGRE